MLCHHPTVLYGKQNPAGRLARRPTGLFGRLARRPLVRKIVFVPYNIVTTGGELGRLACHPKRACKVIKVSPQARDSGACHAGLREAGQLGFDTAPRLPLQVILILCFKNSLFFA